MTIKIKFDIAATKIGIKQSEVDFGLRFQAVQTVATADPYEGAYEVIPKRQPQVLETAQKFMADDVTVNEIPAYEVSNTAGGTTITIGKEV